jgi:hypothetical protein
LDCSDFSNKAFKNRNNDRAVAVVVAVKVAVVAVAVAVVELVAVTVAVVPVVVEVELVSSVVAVDVVYVIVPVATSAMPTTLLVLRCCWMRDRPGVTSALKSSMSDTLCPSSKQATATTPADAKSKPAQMRTARRWKMAPFLAMGWTFG